MATLQFKSMAHQLLRRAVRLPVSCPNLQPTEQLLRKLNGERRPLLRRSIIFDDIVPKADTVLTGSDETLVKTDIVAEGSDELTPKTNIAAEGENLGNSTIYTGRFSGTSPEESDSHNLIFGQYSHVPLYPSYEIKDQKFSTSGMSAVEYKQLNEKNNEVAAMQKKTDELLEKLADMQKKNEETMLKLEQVKTVLLEKDVYIKILERRLEEVATVKKIMATRQDSNPSGMSAHSVVFDGGPRGSFSCKRTVIKAKRTIS